MQCRLRCTMQCRLRPLQPPRTQVLVAEYIKGSCGISPARATVSLTEMEQRARARAAEEAAAERQQQAMLASLAASIAQQALLTYCRYTCYGHAYYGCAHRVRGAAGGTHTKPSCMRLQPV